MPSDVSLHMLGDAFLYQINIFLVVEACMLVNSWFYFCLGFLVVGFLKTSLMVGQLMSQEGQQC